MRSSDDIDQRNSRARAHSGRPALRRRRWRELEWPLVGSAALVALALGMSGFARYAAARGQELSNLDVLYLAIQLIPLQSGALPGPLPPELQVARFLLPVLAGYAATKTLALLFRDQLQLQRLRMMRDHTVVCGLGRKGALLAAAYSTRGQVVVIEKNPDNDDVTRCRESGVVVLTGDATDPVVLAQARAERARTLISVCGGDGVNAEVAVQARGLVARDGVRRGRTRQRPILSCVVHLVDPELCDLVRESEIRSQEVTGVRLSFFNVFATGAQALLDRFPPAGDATDGRGPPHVLIVGVGALGESVTAQAARSWWDRHRGGRRFKLTIVDRFAGSKAELLSLRYPRLTDACELVPVEIDVRSPDFYRAQFLTADPPVSIVYVCLDDEARALAAALDLHERLQQNQVPIVVRMAEETGLAKLLPGAGSGGAFEHLHAFGLLDRTCVPDLVERGAREVLARAIHATYQRVRVEQGQDLVGNPSLAAWEDLGEDFRESSRAQADEVCAKLQTLGYELAPRRDWCAATAAFSHGEIEILARSEHERFMRERLAAGWRYAPGPKDVARKTNRTLDPWASLPDSEKEVDRVMMRDLPRSLAAIGFGLRRVTTRPPR